MKTIAFYLPQYHRIPENDLMWGEGFTEWDNLKKAKKLYPNHNQPRIPKDNRYYNLLDTETLLWQVDLAKKYDIYGFCFYHYWFDGKLLLEKPLEIFLENKNLDINFCLCWPNEPWTKAWVSKSDEVLYEQTYGKESAWREHFEYLLPFFKDDRYIKEDNKPVFIIYRPELITCLNEMLDYFYKCAKESGFNGMVFAYQQIDFDMKKDKDDSRFKYNIEYEPAYAMHDVNSKKKNYSFAFNVGKKIDKIFFRLFNRTLSEVYLKKVRRMKYDELWEACINRIPENDKHVAGVFVDWDNTPRRGTKGVVVEGASPEKFKIYFAEKVKKVKERYSSDYIFIFAWNEWTEGGYLEPDEKYGLGYLESIKDVLNEKNYEM